MSSAKGSVSSWITHKFEGSVVSFSLFSREDNLDNFGDSDHFSETSNWKLKWEHPHQIILAVFHSLSCTANNYVSCFKALIYWKGKTWNFICPKSVCTFVSWNLLSVKVKTKLKQLVMQQLLKDCREWGIILTSLILNVLSIYVKVWWTPASMVFHSLFAAIHIFATTI